MFFFSLPPNHFNHHNVVISVHHQQTPWWSHLISRNSIRACVLRNNLHICSGLQHHRQHPLHNNNNSYSSSNSYNNSSNNSYSSSSERHIQIKWRSKIYNDIIRLSYWILGFLYITPVNGISDEFLLSHFLLWVKREVEYIFFNEFLSQFEASEQPIILPILWSKWETQNALLHLLENNRLVETSTFVLFCRITILSDLLLSLFRVTRMPSKQKLCIVFVRKHNGQILSCIFVNEN